VILFLADYSTTFRKLAQHLEGAPPIASITANQVREFLAAQRGISKKTLLNMHVGLSARVQVAAVFHQTFQFHAGSSAVPSNSSVTLTGPVG
jgi:hypothetical protein